MIKCVIQAADIHIRNVLRHDEYGEQLSKFIESCKEIAKDYERDEMRILLCGDIVHQKIQISNELMIFTSSFIRQLSEIAKVIVYSGNHDLLVNNNSRTDTLTALFETSQFQDVFYLDEMLGYRSGCLVDENITWVLYSIHDNYHKPSLDEVLSTNPNNTMIGLYHGTIIGAQLNNGQVIEDGFDGDELFNGCQYVMAGDIHKRQELKRGDVLIVYPGSLIQQNYGETITQHGFAVWDIENGTHKFIDLPTDYGFYNFEINDFDDIANDKEKLINY